jgi:hypothetical protein
MRSYGLTLLELLLASVLTTLLMVGVLSVVASLGSSAVGAAEGGRTDPEIRADSIRPWIDLLRDDVAHADELTMTRDNVLKIIGHAALDRGDRLVTHRPVEIHYAFRDVDGRRWLVRFERALDVMTNRNIRCDLVSGDIAGFELTQNIVRTPAAGEPAEPSPADQQQNDKGGDSRLNDRIAGFDQGLLTYRPYVERWNHHVWYNGRFYPTWIRPEHIFATADGTAEEPLADEQMAAMLGAAGPDASRIRTVVRIRVWTDRERKQVYEQVVAVR